MAGSPKTSSTCFDTASPSTPIYSSPALQAIDADFPDQLRLGEHLGDLRHLLFFEQARDLLARGGIFRRKVDLIDFPFCQFLDRPEQQDDDDVFAHGGGRQAERGHLMELVIGGIVGEDNELRSRLAHTMASGLGS